MMRYGVPAFPGSLARFTALALGLACGIGASGVIINVTHGRHTPISSADPGCPPRVLCSELAAIQAAIAELPDGYNPHSPIARLLSFEEALQWRNATLADLENPGPLPPAAQKPVWLAAVLTDNLHVSDFSPVPPADDPSIVGLWFILMASGGAVESMGGLNGIGSYTEPGYMTYASIQFMPNYNIPIPEPTSFPTVTPGPEPTTEP